MDEFSKILSNNSKANKWLMFAVLLLLWGAMYLPKLGVIEVQGTESRRMMPAAEMYHGGSLMIPKLAGKEYIAKPPLIYWLQTASYYICGESAASARIPTAVCVLLFASVLLLMSSTWLSLYGRFIGAVIFLSTEGVIMAGRSADIDGGYMAITGLAILVWLNLYYSEKSNLKLWTVSGILLGLGMLFKGPLILLFFYLTLIIISIFEKSLKKVFCKEHIIGIVIMLVMFMPWMLYVTLNYHSDAVAASGGAQASNYWLGQMLERFNPAHVRYGKWIGRSLGAIVDFAPWFLLLPLLWVKKWTKNIPEDKLKIFKALRLVLVIGFLIINVPGTRSRYSLPLYPLAAMLVGWLIAVNTEENIVTRIWKKILVAIFAVLGVASCLLIILGPTGLLTFILTKFFAGKLDLTNDVIVILPGYIISLVVFLVTLGAIFVLHKRKDKYRNCIHLTVLTAIGMVLITMNIFTMVMPFADIAFHKKQLGVAVTSVVPKKSTLNIYKLGYEPYFYYFNVPLAYIAGNKSLPEADSNPLYFFINKNQYKGLCKAYAGKYKFLRVLTEKKYKDDIFYVVEFTNTP